MKNKFTFSDILSCCLSLWIFFILFPLLFQFEKFFGANHQILDYFIKEKLSFSYFLFDVNSIYLNAVCIFVLFFISITKILYKFKFRVFLIIIEFILIQNIQVYIFPSLSSGWIVIRLLFCYLIISELFSLFTKGSKTDFFLIPIVRFQVVTIYFFAFCSKMTGSDWVNGTAVELSLRHPQYSLFSEYVSYLPSSFYLIINYLVLSYQLVFPLVFTNLKIRHYILAFGLMFHLFTFILYGLWTFYISMSLSLLSFYFPWDRNLYKRE